MPTYPFYSVKVKNRVGRVPKDQKHLESHFKHARTSFFPYDRFYLFHKDDMAFVDRMFYVYLLHTITDEIGKYLADYVDVEVVTSLGPSYLTRKVSNEVLKEQQQSKIPWHVGRSKIENYRLVVPTYTLNTAFSTRSKHKNVADGHAIGYVRSKYHIARSGVGDIIFEETPKLVINKEVIPNPCMFCERYIDGFQTGACKFGTLVCYEKNTIFTPNERKTVQDDDVPGYGAYQV
jgi:hypothetical protein